MRNKARPRQNRGSREREIMEVRMSEREGLDKTDDRSEGAK